MTTKVVNKYLVQVKVSKKKKKSIWELAKKHLLSKSGVEKNLSANIDSILYGKK